MTRTSALPVVMLLASCSGLAPTEIQGTAFQNPQTGQIVRECGPMQGFKGAIDEARKGCTDSYKSASWRPVNESAAQLPE